MSLNFSLEVSSFSKDNFCCNSFRIALTAIRIPNPYSALSSNKEFAHAGPCPSILAVYTEAGDDAPQIEEHPVAFAITIRSPNNCVTTLA